MAAYIIALILGILVFLWQNLKPTSIGFRIAYLILAVIFLWCMYYTGLGSWLFVIIPVGMLVLAFICAMIFPYGYKSAITELNFHPEGKNFFQELSPLERIGKYQAPGFKQTYDRIIVGLLSSVVKSQSELETIGNALYSKNFYPISQATKQDVLEHVEQSLKRVPRIMQNNSYNQIIEPLFNAYVSVMSVHEEATDKINRLKADKY